MKKPYLASFALKTPLVVKCNICSLAGYSSSFDMHFISASKIPVILLVLIVNIFTPGYGVSMNDESAMYDAWSSFLLEHHADLLASDNPNRNTAGASGSTWFNNEVNSEVLYNLISEFMSNLRDYLGEDYGSEVAGSEVYAFFKQLAEDSDLAGYVEQRKQAEADIVTYSQDLA